MGVRRRISPIKISAFLVWLNTIEVMYRLKKSIRDNCRNCVTTWLALGNLRPPGRPNSLHISSEIFPRRFNQWLRRAELMWLIMGVFIVMSSWPIISLGWHYQWDEGQIGHVTLVAIAGTIILTPCLWIKSLQPIWRSGIDFVLGFLILKWVAGTWLHCHDDVIKWKHFPRYWPFVRGIHQPPVNSPHKGQWRGVLMFSLICVYINGWENSREAGDFRRYRAHYDVIVMVGIRKVAPTMAARVA